MTERDLALIEEAGCLYWADIDEDAADTEEGRRALHSIKITKFHREESVAGMI